MVLCDHGGFSSTPTALKDSTVTFELSMQHTSQDSVKNGHFTMPEVLSTKNLESTPQGLEDFTFDQSLCRMRSEG